MKLMNQEIEKKFEQFPLYSQDGKGMSAKVVVKYFNPYGSGTWLITEGEKQEDGDWLFFGYCHIFCWEWGYVTLSELESVGFIERDLYAGQASVKDLLGGGDTYAAYDIFNINDLVLHKKIKKGGESHDR